MPVFINKGTQLDASDLDAVIGAPNLTNAESNRFTNQNHGTFIWTLDASAAGKQIAALPDVAIIGNGKPGQSFLQDQVQFYSIVIYQRYTATPTFSGDPVEGLTRLASAGIEPDQVLAAQYSDYLGVNSFFVKLILPALRADTSDALYSYDFADEYVVTVTGTNGVIDDGYPTISDPFQGRFLMVIGQVGGQRNNAWGDWLEVLDPSGGGGGGGDPDDPKVINPGRFADSRDDLQGAAAAGADALDLPGEAIELLDKAGTYAGDVMSANELFSYVSRLSPQTDSWSSNAVAQFLNKKEVNTAVSATTKAIDAISSAYAGYQTYKETGSPKKAFADATIKFLAALASGEAGTVAGLGAAHITTTIIGTSFLAGTGLPILVGLGVGIAFGAAVNFSIKYAYSDAGFYSYKPGDKFFRTADQPLDDDLALGAERKSIGIDLGDKPYTPKWTYNVKKQKFVWLDDDLARKYKKIATAMEINPKPVGLKLEGDKFKKTSEDFLTGQAKSDKLLGKRGDDVLVGNKGGDRLFGGDGNDALFGGAGRDHLDGGGGNDALDGGSGNDVLIGGAGADTFIFASPPDGVNVDEIRGFVSGEDRIELPLDAFPDLLWGILPALAVGEAVTPGAQIVRDGDQLYYDPDGSAPVAKVRFAILEPGTLLSASDIEVTGTIVVTS
jgi:hypothetical protein